MPGEKYKSFKVGDTHYDIPESKAGEFTKQFKDAKEYHSFVVDKDTFDIPVDQSQRFIAEKKNAKPLYDYGIKPAATKPIPVTKPKTVEEPSRFDELLSSVNTEGITNTIKQVWNYFTEPENKKPIPAAYVPKNPTIKVNNQTTELSRADIRTEKIKLDSLDNVLKKKEAVVALGDTIHNYGGDPNRYIVPQRIKLEDVETGVRSRGEETDLNTAGAIFSTYKKWRAPNDGWQFNFHSFLAYDKANKKISVVPRDKTKELNNDNYLVTGTYSHDVEDIDLDSGKFNPGINSNTLGYTSPGGKKGTVPVFGKGTGTDLGGYVGGKVILTTPDFQHPEIIYGSAETIRKEVARYKAEHKVASVKLHEADGKAYAQTYQTKNKVIPAKKMLDMDNLNSSSAESGSFVYFK